MNYSNYTILQGDTLESISARLLGDASLWRGVAVLNNLRWPFISAEPIFQYGTAILTGTLSSAISVNQPNYQFQVSELPVYAAQYAAGTVFYVQYSEFLDQATRTITKYDAMVLAQPINETTGLLTFKPSIALNIEQDIVANTMATQTVTVTNIGGITIGSQIAIDSGGAAETIVVAGVATGSITALFTKNHSAGIAGSWGFTHSYPLGTAFWLFPIPGEVRTSVLRPGDTLRLPSLGSLGSLAGQVGDAHFVDLLGTDIQVLADGTIAFDVNGDLQLVSGHPNLWQAIQLRIGTPLAERPHTPAYGNPLWDFVGHNNSPYYLALVQAITAQAIAADPRVNRVTSLTVSNPQPNVVLLDAQVELRDGSGLLRTDNLVVRL